MVRAELEGEQEQDSDVVSGWVGVLYAGALRYVGSIL